MPSTTSYEAFCEQVGLNPDISWYRSLYQGIADHVPPLLENPNYETMRKRGTCRTFDLATGECRFVYVVRLGSVFPMD